MDGGDNNKAIEYFQKAFTLNRSHPNVKGNSSTRKIRTWIVAFCKVFSEVPESRRFRKGSGYDRQLKGVLEHLWVYAGNALLNF